MASIRSLTVLALATFILDAAARFAPAHKIHQAPVHKHEARDLGKRMVGPPHMPVPRQAVPTTSSEADALTYITPSPGAKPIAVTEQSQYVTSFVPQYTLCALEPIAFYSASPYRPSLAASTAPYRNYSISIPEGNGTCTTVYEPTHTMVCATTLTGLFDKWTVSKCDQDLTFSTQYGYVLVTPTPTPAAAITPSLAVTTSSAVPSVASSVAPLNDTMPTVINGTNGTLQLQSIALVVPRQASMSEEPTESAVVDPTITPGPSIETLTTYYLAPWQELTAGTVPSDIDLKVCRTFTNGTEKCVSEYESWHTSLVTKTTSSVTSVNISTTIHGLSQIIVETYVANVTELLTTFSMSTTIDVGYATEFETTHVTTREPTVTSTSPTIYLTKTLEEARPVFTQMHYMTRNLTLLNSETRPSSDEDITSTITIRRTSTVTTQTSTITTTIPSASASTITQAPATDDVDSAAESEADVADDSEDEEVTVDVTASGPQTTDFASMLGINQPGGARRA